MAAGESSCIHVNLHSNNTLICVTDLEGNDIVAGSGVLLVGGLGRSVWARGRRLKLQWIWQAAKSGSDRQGTLAIVHEQGSELGI